VRAGYGMSLKPKFTVLYYVHEVKTFFLGENGHARVVSEEE
jgi:hypothetical protein